MCFCPDDDGVLDFRSTSHPKARKARRCAECARLIQPGERYERTVVKWEGSISSWTVCLGCSAWGDAFAQASEIVCGCSGWLLGGMWEAIGEFTREHLGYHAGGVEDGACGEVDPKLRDFTLRTTVAIREVA